MIEDHSKKPSKLPVPKLRSAGQAATTTSTEPVAAGPDESGERGASVPPALAAPDADVEHPTKGAQARIPRPDEFDSFPTLETVLEALAAAGACPTEINRGPNYGRKAEYGIECPWAAEHPEGQSDRAIYVDADAASPFGQFRCACERDVMDLMLHIGVLDYLRPRSPISTSRNDQVEAARSPATGVDCTAEPRLTGRNPRGLSDEPEGLVIQGNRAERRAIKSALARFSLRGKADEIEASAAEAKPLLGPFVLRGQATMIYAAPNTGKTLVVLRLCLDAIAAKRIDPNKLFFFNADDSLAGLATKVRLLQEVGAHMLAPGREGLRPGNLVSLLTQMIEEGSAHGTCVIIDTLKKVSDLMDKRRSSEFNDVCRQFVMAGGTIVALGHTTKTPHQNGTPRYQGTTDVLEDFDAVYVAEPMTSKGGEERLIKLTRLKCRGDNPEVVAYAYAADPDVSYTEKLASVHPVHPDDLADYRTEKEQVSDPPVMDAIVKLIAAGCTDGKMELAKKASTECGVSHKAAIRVLERYTGDTPREHLWNFRTGLHGRQGYYLIDQAKPAQ